MTRKDICYRYIEPLKVWLLYWGIKELTLPVDR
jgi:hypothetical protein